MTWGLIPILTTLVLAGTVAAFGYAGSAGWLAATARPGARQHGLRAFAAVGAAVAAAGLHGWAVATLTPETTVSSTLAVLPTWTLLLGYPVGYAGGLIHRVRSRRTCSVKVSAY